MKIAVNVIKLFWEVIEISPKLRMDKLHKNAKQFYFSTTLEWPLLVVSLNDEIYLFRFPPKKGFTLFTLRFFPHSTHSR